MSARSTALLVSAAVISLIAALTLLAHSPAAEASRHSGSAKPQLIYTQGQIVRGRDSVDVCVRGANVVLINGGRGALAGSCKKGGTIFRRQFHKHKTTRIIRVRAKTGKDSPKLKVSKCVAFRERPSRSC